MKAKYTKPVLHMETFSLSQSVATNCGAAHSSTLGGPTWGDATNCVWKLSEYETYFLMGSSCTIEFTSEEANTPGIFENMCYNNPTPGQSIFSS